MLNLGSCFFFTGTACTWSHIPKRFLYLFGSIFVDDVQPGIVPIPAWAQIHPISIAGVGFVLNWAFDFVSVLFQQLDERFR